MIHAKGFKKTFPVLPAGCGKCDCVIQSNMMQHLLKDTGVCFQFRPYFLLRVDLKLHLHFGSAHWNRAS